MNQRVNNYYLWLSVSLIVTLYYGVVSYYYASSYDYIVQDDVRQHIVWLQKYIDPELFPNDIIADYFQKLAPLGFKNFYYWAAKAGIEPVSLSKIIPTILAIATTIYSYLFCLKIIPRASCAFLSTLFINQLMWLNDDLISATPRAFLYPLLAGFLYYLSTNSLIPCLVLMLLQGLFYPHILLIEMTVLSLRLLAIERNRFKLISDKQPYIWWTLGAIVTVIALLPLIQKPPELATVLTAEQMRQMPEFHPGGRTPFFGIGWLWLKYLFIENSGLSLPFFPTIVWCSLALPWLLKTKLPTVNLITNKIAILFQVTIASLLMFILSHLTLPLLHLPSRFTYHSLRVVLGFTTAIVLTISIDAGKKWFDRKLRSPKLKLLDKIKLALVAVFSTAIVVVPGIPFIFTEFQNWKIGTAAEIYRYLTQQPKDIFVASLSSEANNIPAFTLRSILVGDEFAFAYHPAYYSQIERRTVDLLQAQYTSNAAVLKSFIEKYGIDYFLLDRNAFTPQYLLEKDWLINSSWRETTEQAIAQLELNPDPLLSKLSSCSVVSSSNLDLLSSYCILDRLQLEDGR